MIKNIFNSIFSISDTAHRKLESVTNYVNFEKNEVFITKHKPDKYEYVIIEGFCKSFLISPEGDDITISFYGENSILSPYHTRTSKGISLLHVQSLTPMKAAIIDADEFESLMIEDLEIREFGNTVLRNELMRKVQKEIGLASMTAKERLIQLRKEFPLLEVTVPHIDIASYLGITNISLSRLRKELIR